MRRITITICTASFLFACNSGDKKTAEAKTDEPIVAAAAEKKNEPAPDSVMMKNWQAYMTPGKEQKMMASWNGTWTGEVSMWMKPGDAPIKSTGTTTNKMILGNRYQQSSHKSSFNNMPFEGLGTLAFDNAKKLFIATWIDNMGSGIMTGEGPWDERTKTITIKGKMVDPGTGRDIDFREVFRIIDNNYQVVEMYAPGGPD